MANRFKAWDIVRVKSLDWWETNKDEYGDVIGNEYNFTEEMNIFCGSLMLITKVQLNNEDGDGYSAIPYHMNIIDSNGNDIDCDYIWQDFMFEDKPVMRLGNTRNILSFGDFYIISDFNNKCAPKLYDSIEDAERDLQSYTS